MQKGFKSVLLGAAVAAGVCAVSAAERYVYNAQPAPWPATDHDPRLTKVTLTANDLPTKADLLATKKHIAVLFMGSDWCEAGNRLLLEWRKGLGSSDYVTTVYDWPERDDLQVSDSGSLSALSRDNNHAGSFFVLGGAGDRQHVYPAIGFFDPNGCLYALSTGVEPMSNAALQALASQAKAAYATYTNFKNRAAKSDTNLLADMAGNNSALRLTGDMLNGFKDPGGRDISLNTWRAALLARGLMAFESVHVKPASLASRRSDDLAKIRAWDPDDVSGAIARLTQEDLYGTAQSWVNYAKDTAKQTDYASRLNELVTDNRLIPLADNVYQQRALFGTIFYSSTADKITWAKKAVTRNPSTAWGEIARGVLLWRGGYDTAPVLSTGWTAQQNPSGAAFTWDLRYGNDIALDKRGWYTLTLSVPQSAATPTLTNIQIWQGVKNTAAPTDEQLVFDTAARVCRTPVNGEDQASVRWLSGWTVSGDSKTASVTFYLPQDTDRVVSTPYRVNPERGTYDDVRILISGTGAGVAGTFGVTRHEALDLRATPLAEAPRFTVDGATLSVAEAQAAWDAVLQAKEPAANGRSGADTASAIASLLATDRDYRAALARKRLFELVGAASLDNLLTTTAHGKEVLEAVLADETLLEDLIASGPAKGGFARLLHRLAILWRTDELFLADWAADHPDQPLTRGRLAAPSGDPDHDPWLRRAAVALALNGIGDAGIGRNYRYYRAAAERGLLHHENFVQSVPDLRYSLNPQGFSCQDLEYAVKSSNSRIGSIGGAAWQVAYRMNDFFGSGIFSGYYGKPWGYTLLRGYAQGHYVGAVCGGISHWGTLCAHASGRRSVTGGQPGHCAAMHRAFDGVRWDIDYSVESPTGCHFSIFGMTTYQSVEYIDDQFADPNTRAGYRLMWAAAARAARCGAAEPGVEALYRLAFDTAPLAYEIANAYLAWLKATYPADAGRFLQWGEAVARGHWRYPSFGWPLLQNNIPSVLTKAYGKPAAVAAFMQFHRMMPMSTRPTREYYTYAKTTLASQRSLFVPDADFLQLLGSVMDGTYGTSLFNQAVSWGNTTFGIGNIAFSEMLSKVYTQHGNPDGIRKTAYDTLLSASQTGDIDSFRQMAELLDVLAKETPERDTAEPPYTGKLLSVNGLARLSSIPETMPGQTLDEARAPYRYLARVIDASAFGATSVWTGETYEEPWLLVQLQGESKLSGIVIQNAGERGEFAVDVSADAESWTTVTESLAIGPGETVTVDGDNSTSLRYVRVRRQNPTYAAMTLHLHKVQVYGTPCY